MTVNGGKNEILKQQIKLLTNKTTCTRQIKVLSQASIHLNNQPVWPVAPHVGLGIPPKTTNTVKIWKSLETAIVPTLTVDPCAMLLRTLSSIMPGKVLSTRICSGMLTRMGELLHTPG